MIKLKTNLIPMIVATYAISRFSSGIITEPTYYYDTIPQTLNFETEAVLDQIITENFKLVLSNINSYSSIYDVLDDLGVAYDKTVLDEHLKNNKDVSWMMDCAVYAKNIAKQQLGLSFEVYTKEMNDLRENSN